MSAPLLPACTTTQLISAPRFVGAVTTLDATTQVVGNRKPRDQVDELWVDQADLTTAFDTGGLTHTLVDGRRDCRTS